MHEDLLQIPNEIWKVEECFKFGNSVENNFLKGTKWSPDGKCLLTSSDDNILRIFEPSSFYNDEFSNKSKNPVLSYKEGESIYDFCWYPHMSSDNPISCVFACSSHYSPVHLWDAWTGNLRATYQCINQFDEVTTAYSLCLSPNGKLFCGLRKEIRIFDLCRPGRISDQRPFKTNESPSYQSGIASAIATNPIMADIYAVGSYDKSVGLYCESDGSLLCLHQAQLGGVTHLLFSNDGTRLYSGGRNDPEIICWDLRYPGTILFIAKRTVKTQQRIYFDVTPDGKYLVTGCTDGFVEIFDTDLITDEQNVLPAAMKFRAHDDCTNGVSINIKFNVMATCSGQRHVKYPNFSDSDEDLTNGDSESVENSVKVWMLPPWMSTKTNDPNETINVESEIINVENAQQIANLESEPD